jgi:hypothetical protein
MIFFTLVRFSIIPKFPVLVNGGLSPEILCCDDVILLWEDTALFSAENEDKMCLSGTSD